MVFEWSIIAWSTGRESRSESSRGVVERFFSRKILVTDSSLFLQSKLPRIINYSSFLSSPSKECRTALMIATTIANNIPYPKPSTVNPGIKYAASITSMPLITNTNSPSVTTERGRVNRTSTGRKIELMAPKITATTSAATKPSTPTPGKA